MGQKPLEIGDFETRLATFITSENRMRGGTVRSLAEASGISRSRLDRLLKGEGSITLTDLNKLARALGLEPWKIFFATETGRPYGEADMAVAERRIAAGADRDEEVVPVNAQPVVAQVLRENADRQNLSGAEIARRSGVSQAQVSRVFAHKRAVSVDHVLAIAHALGLRGSDVFAEAERRIATEADRDEAPMPASAAPAPKPITPAAASSTGYRTRWAGVREPPRHGPAIGEQERMAALAGSADEDFEYPADAGEEPQD